MRKPVIYLAFANDQTNASEYLESLTKEKEAIEKVLAPLLEEEKVDVVITENTTIETVFDTFSDQRYKERIVVFHFAGHANSYQLLLESASGNNESAHGEALMRFLSTQHQLRLLFLNACSTQKHAKDSLRLTNLYQKKGEIRKNALTIIATSEKIIDDIAFQFSTQFYKTLVQNNTLEDCFNGAKSFVETLHGSGNHRDLFFEDDEDDEDDEEEGVEEKIQKDNIAWDIYYNSNRRLDNTIHWKLFSPNPILELVTSGRLKKAIDSLIEAFQERDKELLKELKSLKSKFRRLDRKNKSGMLSDTDFENEQNKITHLLTTARQTIAIHQLLHRLLILTNNYRKNRRGCYLAVVIEFYNLSFEKPPP